MRFTVAALCLCAMASAAIAATHPEALSRKVSGNEYQKRRQYEAARDQYLEALKLEPDFSDVHYNLGILYFYRLKDYARALYHFNAYRRMEPGASDMGQVTSHVAQSITRLEEQERDEYKSAVMEASASAFEDFLDRNPVGYYADIARTELGLIRKYEDAVARREAAIEAAFSGSLEEATPEAMDRFLTQYPNVPQAEEARKLREMWLLRRETENAAYQKAVEADTIAAFEAFIDEHPDGEFTDKARSRASHLEGADESLTLALEAGSIAAIEKWLELYSDTPFAEEAGEALEELRKAEVEKAATAEALKVLTDEEPELAPEEAAKDEEATSEALKLLEGEEEATEAITPPPSPAPAPVEAKETVPAEVEKPEPVKAEEAEPVKVEEPEPVKVEEPEPVKVEEPEPVEAEEPEPVEVEEPEPVKVEEPEPVKVEEPEPVEIEKAEPVKVEKAESKKVMAFEKPAEVEEAPADEGELTPLQKKIKAMKEAEARRQSLARKRAERMKAEEAMRQQEAKRRADEMKRRGLGISE